MPTKQGPLGQHQLLHQYWPHDCCLCAKEQEIEYLKAQLVIGKEENAELHTALVEQTSAATEAARQLAEADGRQRMVEEAYERNCRELEAELAALRMEWKTGRIPEDGVYWVDGPSGQEVIYLEAHYNDDLAYQRWAGPIQPPAEPQELPEKEGK